MKYNYKIIQKLASSYFHFIKWAQDVIKYIIVRTFSLNFDSCKVIDFMITERLKNCNNSQDQKICNIIKLKNYNHNNF